MHACRVVQAACTSANVARALRLGSHNCTSLTTASKYVPA